MNTPFPIDHVGVATPSIADAARHYELLTGARCSPIETLPDQGVHVAFVGPIELIQPTHADTSVGRFIERRGPGLHHLAVRVPDIEGELSRLASEGVELIDSEPRVGAGGHLVAFVHPRSAGGILWELVQQ